MEIMKDRIGRFKNLHLGVTPPQLMRAIAVRKIATNDMSFPGITFKIASSEEEMAAAFELLEESYVRRGIARKGKMRLQVISLLPTTTTFIAKKGNDVIATISLIEDSDLSLPMEKIHPEEVAAVRRLFRKVAEVGALAVRPEYRRTGLSIMLYNMMYRWGRYWRHVDDLLIAVHPSARYFYRNILLFRPVGPVQPYEGLSGAASLPMRLDIPGAQMQFHRIYHKRIVDRQRGLDFYDFFCAPTDRFDFSAHPDFCRDELCAGSFRQGEVSRLLSRFQLVPEEMAESEANALRRHFPDIDVAMDRLA